jgi:hypothetical protein
MKLFILAVFILLLAVPGCGDQQHVDAVVADKALVEKDDFMIPIASKLRGETLDAPERQAQLRAVIPFARTMQDLKPESDWQAVNMVVKTQLQAYQDHPQSYVVEQLAGNLMLRRYLLKEDATPASLDAISHYTELLLRNNHEDASVLLPAFRALKGRWSPERLIASIDQSIGNARAWLDRVSPCEDCPKQSQLSKAVADQASLPMHRRASEVAFSLPLLAELRASL